MINNYVKDGILPAPVKKKYSKEHLLLLVLIYYLKNILSIKDVESIIKPLSEKYFHAEEGLNITDIYNTFAKTEPRFSATLKEDIIKSHSIATSLFHEAPDEEREMLQQLTFIYTLIFDVYAKKQLIEAMIDSLTTE